MLFIHDVLALDQSVESMLPPGFPYDSILMAVRGHRKEVFRGEMIYIMIK